MLSTALLLKSVVVEGQQISNTENGISAISTQ